MALDTDKIDDAVLALLFLTLHDHWRAWKGFDWDALNRLYDKGLIGDPVNKAKSVVFTEEGLRRAEELFRAMFLRARPERGEWGLIGRAGGAFRRVLKPDLEVPCGPRLPGGTIAAPAFVTKQT